MQRVFYQASGKLYSELLMRKTGFIALGRIEPDSADHVLRASGVLPGMISKGKGKMINFFGLVELQSLLVTAS